LPTQAVRAIAAVIAIKNNTPEANPETRASTLSILDFHEKAALLFKKNGGTIIGAESDLVSVCFGSPLERIYLRGRRNTSPYEGQINAQLAPALKAVEVVTDMAKQEECENWHFGIDLGSCIFLWSPLSGYFAIGSPVQRAASLSRLGLNYNAQVIVSAPVNDALPDMALKKLAALKNPDGSQGDAFYGLNY